MPASPDTVRVGIHAGQQNTDYASYKQLWLTAERLGLDWVSCFDHFMPIQADPTGPCLEGYSVLSALAEATSSIAIGIIVTGVTYRHPAVLANIAATIDHVSNGRVEIGLGAAWYELEHEQYGIEFPPLSVRAELLDECSTILKRLWSQETTDFAGRHFHLAGARCEPKPIQEGGIFLWIGGTGERRTLPLVGRHADGWNTFLMPIDEYKHKCEVLEAYCRDEKRDPSSIRRALVVMAILGEDEADANEAVRERASRTGLSEAELRDRFIVGTPGELAEQLVAYHRLGVRDFLVQARPPMDVHQLELMAGALRPALQNL